ncbi:MAG: GGDEF domain-containing protein [Pseudomonadota bacterium]
MADVFLKNNSARSVSDRAQRIAFLVSIAGAFLNTLLFSMYMINDGLSSLLITNFLFYMIPLSAIALSSYHNWNFQMVLDAGIATVYFYMWGTTFYDAIMGHPSALSYPTLLFMPFLLILVTRHQLLIAYAITQAVLVYAYGAHFMVDAFELDSPDLNPSMIAILLALLSSITLLTLAIVAYSRQKTDNRLLALVQETERMAAQDPLTELKNRRAFMEDLERLRALKTPFAVAFIDLDRFKPLNDEFGHAAGDEVLKSIASRLQVAPYMVSAARLGGGMSLRSSSRTIRTKPKRAKSRTAFMTRLQQK